MKFLRIIKDDILYTKVILGIAVRFRALFAAISFSTLFVSLFNGVSISLVIPFIYNIQNKKAGSFFLFRKLGISFSDSETELIAILAIILFSSVLVNAFTFACEYLGYILQEKAIIDIRNRMLKSIYRHNSKYFVDNATGDLVNLFFMQVNQTGFSIFTTIQFLMNICVCLIFITLLILISPVWTLIVVIVFGILSSITQFVTRKIHDFISEVVKLQEKTNSDFVNDILGIKILKIFKMQKTRFEAYQPLFHRIMDRQLQSQKRVSFVPTFMEAASVAFVMVFLITLLKTDPQGFYSDIPFIIAFFTIMQRLKTGIIKVNHYRALMQRAKKYVYNVVDFLKDADFYEDEGTILFEEFKDSIEFKDVRFEYEAGRPILKGVSFKVNKGETVAIVGGSGSGKTTISDLLFKFMEPTSGEILIDGVNLRDIQRSSFYERTGLVQQETFLFNNTIEWNIARGELERFNSDMVKQAARFANVAEFISKLDKGYKTQVGDRGGKLSGGEKQRLGIARAVVHDPEIIVLDEPTSALDTRNERAVIESIKNISRGRTVFIITHKLSSIAHANKIIVMNDGEVAGIGSHEELAASNKTYIRLLQSDSDDDEMTSD